MGSDRLAIHGFAAPRSLLILFLSITLQIFSGLTNDPSSSKNEGKDGNHNPSGKISGVKILLLVILGLVAVVGFGGLLFKLWQKKKRAEQHARLLKLFEEDDELEVELGMRD